MGFVSSEVSSVVQGVLRGLLLPAELPVRRQRLRALRDVPPQSPGGPAPAQAAALRVQAGASPAGGMGDAGCAAASASSRLASHSAPGVSVSPWTMIETKTAS